MRRAFQGKIHQISQSKLRSPDIKSAGSYLLAQDRGDLEVDQFRRGQRLTTQSGPGRIPLRTVIGQGNGQDAGINDEHDPPARP